MRQRKLIKITLGDLIVAVTDEVMAILRDTGDAYVVASWVLNDILTRQRVRDHKVSRRKYRSLNSMVDKAPLSCRVRRDSWPRSDDFGQSEIQR